MNAGVLITVRLKSERLPAKALRPLAGRPLLGHLVDRLRCLPGRAPIVLCTSHLSSDDALEEFAIAEGLGCFRGEPTDVLRRMRDAALAFGFENVLSCTGDNPLVDPQALAELEVFHRMGGYAFSRTSGLPWGAFGYALQTEALARACELAGTDDTEVWGGYFTQSGLFRCGVLEITDPRRHAPDLRFTVDTAEDFATVEAIFRALQRPGAVFEIAEAIAFCRAHPEVAALNARVVQKAAPAPRFREPVA